MARKVSKILLAVDVPGRWSHERHSRKGELIESGYTSVRISKLTHQRLAILARAVSQQSQSWSSSWRSDVPLTELLDWIATGILIKPRRELVVACRRAIAEMHAPALERESMQRRSRRAARGARR